MVKLPSKIICNGVPYLVIDHKEKSAVFRDIGEVLGRVELDNNLIHIATGVTSLTSSETLLHELMHIAYYDGNLRLTVPHNSNETEEIIVNALTRQLFGMFMANPKLLEYLLSVSKESKNNKRSPS